MSTTYLFLFMSYGHQYLIRTYLFLILFNSMSERLLRPFSKSCFCFYSCRTTTWFLYLILYYFYVWETTMWFLYLILYSLYVWETTTWFLKNYPSQNLNTFAFRIIWWRWRWEKLNGFLTLVQLTSLKLKVYTEVYR